jgi:hypothetical protein
LKPIWAFLSLATLTAIVILLWRSPETRDRISSVILGQPIGATSQPAVQPEQPPEKSAKKPVKAVRRPSKAAVPESAEPVAVETPKAKEPVRIIETGPSLANVKADSAAVYSFN